MIRFLKVLLIATALAASLFSSASDSYGRERLILFHVDFNSVALKEEYIRKWLRIVADMGYNGILWEVEDKVQWQTCRECVSPEAFTKAQFRELLNYSRSLGLRPIPLLQTLGHAEYVLRHRQYAHLREDPARHDCYCPENQAVKTMLKRWIEEYLDLFGDVRYFHLGGDEAHAFGSCRQCRDKITAAGPAGAALLYSRYLEEIAAQLLARGIRPCVWSDMLLKTPRDVPVLDKRFVFFDWNYWDGDTPPQRVRVWSENAFLGKKEITGELLGAIPHLLDGNQNLRPFHTADFLKSHGYDVVLCSSSRSYGDSVFAGRAPLHLANIIGAARKTVEDNLLGNCVTSWAVRLHNYETQAPFILLAPLTIASPELPRLEITRRASRQLFGIGDNAFYETAINAGFPFPFGSRDTTGIMWSGMKDNAPAPHGYIAQLLSKWREKEDGGYWRFQTGIIGKSAGIIAEGQHQLASLAPVTGTGGEILAAWRRAAYFQYYQSLLATGVLSCANGGKSGQTAGLRQLIHSLRREYKSWARQWMTEASAEQASGLIYDALDDYLGDNCRADAGTPH